MIPEHGWILAIGGLVSGLLAGLLGIGGGTVLVPLLVALNYAPVQAVATSSLAIVITSISGTLQNWRMGYFSPSRVVALSLPALLTAQLGVYLAARTIPYLLLSAFGLLLLVNIYLVDLRKRLVAQQTGNSSPEPALRVTLNRILVRVATGGTAGVLAGLFGVGGGVIMVPLQILLLGETIKVAIQTSLGVIVITAISAASGHIWNGNALIVEGLWLGIGGLIGAQISTRFLPKLPDQVVSLAFRALLGVLSVYVFWQAWQSYRA